MADFFTDSDDDKAVDELLSQAMDATVLEQVAKVNCAGFDDDGGLPSHLETRFRKLKSFPSSAPKPAPLSTKSFNLSHTPELKKNDEAKASDSSEEQAPAKCWTKVPSEKSCSSGTLDEIPQGKTKKSVRRWTKSPSFSSCDGYSSRSVSPPARSGCFFCSPKSKSGRKSKGLKSDELLLDLSNSQKRLIKKAMEEEEKICREAEKIVKWAKQASARMEFSGVEDEISDDDESAKFP